MTLESRRPVLTGELDGGLEEHRPNAGAPVAICDGEANAHQTPRSAVSTLAKALLPLTRGKSERGPTLVHPTGCFST